MKENLEEMNSRGVATRWPVLLGGAALTRAYVENDLAELYAGEVRYARDAFEGLRLMDAVMAGQARRRTRRRALPALRKRRVRQVAAGQDDAALRGLPGRSDVATDNPVPTPPFWGDPGGQGHRRWPTTRRCLDERATFLGQWGLRGQPRRDGPSYEELVETEGRPRLRMWLDRIQTEGLLEAAVVYGYFPCVSEGNDLVVLGRGRATERLRFTFPRQRRDRRLCLADFFRPRRESGELDVIAFQLVTMGPQSPRPPPSCSPANAYRDYLELHGLSVQLDRGARRVLARPRPRGARLRRRGRRGPGRGSCASDYRGSRYSFGYPACPDLEDRAKLVRAARAGAHRRRAVRGAPAPPRAVDRRARRAPPRGQVLQCRLTAPP